MIKFIERLQYTWLNLELDVISAQRTSVLNAKSILIILEKHVSNYLNLKHQENADTVG